MQSPRISIGTTLAKRYQAIRKLGTGGMGEVWCCRDIYTQKYVAFKHIRLDSKCDSTSSLKSSRRQLFYEEMKALASLHHPNLVTALDFGHLSDGTPFLVMDYIHGVSLETIWCSDGYLPWDLLAAILSQLLLGLAHIHARGILHRDLKPPNILLSQDTAGALRVHLVDFGIAVVGQHLDEFRPDRLKQSNPVIWGLGTPPYVAPEQLKNQVAFLAPSTDLHAVGVLLHQFCCGTLPYTSRHVSRTLQMILNQPIPPFTPENEPPTEVDTIRTQLLAKQPWERPTFAAQVYKQLQPLWCPQQADREWKRWLWKNGEEFADSQSLEELSSPYTPQYPHPHREESFAHTTLSYNAHVSHSTHEESLETPLIESWRKTSLELMSEIPTTRPHFWETARWDVQHTHHLAQTVSNHSSPQHIWHLLSLRVPAFVGRSHEKQILWSEVLSVHQGQQRVLKIEGSPGMGKSRLAQWLVEQSHEQGLLLHFKVRFGSHMAGRTGLIGAFESHFAFGDKNEQAIRYTLEQRWGIEQEAQKYIQLMLDLLHPEQQHTAAFQTSTNNRSQQMADCFRKITEGQPILLWLDDVQWIDNENVQAIQHILRSEQPILVLMTCNMEHSEERSTALDTLMSQYDGQSIMLQPLHEEDTSELLESILPLALESQKALTSWSEGNPLFVLQQLLHWLQNGKLRWSQNQRVFFAPEDVLEHMAASHKELWEQRIQHYSQDVLESAMLAITLGSSFSQDVFEMLLEASEEPTASISQVLEHQLLQFDQHHLRWSHGSLETFIEEKLAQHERVHSIYMTSVHVLERHPLAYTRSLTRLITRNAVRAGALTKACSTLFTYLEDAWNARRNAQQIQSNLDLLPSILPQKYEVQKWRWTAEAALLLSHHTPAAFAAQRALELYTTHKDQRGAAECKRILGALATSRSCYDEALSWLLEARKDFKLLELPESLAHIDLLLAQTYQYMSRLQDSARHAKNAYLLAEEYNLNSVLIQSCLSQAIAHHDLGEYIEAELWANVTLDACKLGHEEQGCGQAHILLAWLAIADDRMAEAQEHCQQARTYFRSVDVWWWMAISDLTEGWAACWLHEYTSAIRFAQRTQQAFTQYNMQHELGQTWLLRAAIALQMKEYSVAQTALNQVYPYQRPEPMLHQPLALIEAWLAQHEHDPETANQSFQKANRIQENVGLNAWGVRPLLSQLLTFTWPTETQSELEEWHHQLMPFHQTKHP